MAVRVFSGSLFSTLQAVDGRERQPSGSTSREGAGNGAAVSEQRHWRTKGWFAASLGRKMSGLRVVDLNQAQEWSGSVDVLDVQLMFVSGCSFGDEGRGTGMGLGGGLAGTR